MSLERFHPLVADWFRGRFERLSPVQERGFAAIASGRHALLAAPTGSGKTLAAFLTCIDRLVRRGLEGRLEDACEAVYVSPLKALSNDVRLNLEEPLAEIARLAAERGMSLPEIRVGLRTGDTQAAERQRALRRPPHIWVTTPESLYILLTSAGGRRALGTAQTLVLDEIHAVADDKRGAHLALSVERLEALAGRRLQRIGLSATVSPIDEVARWLVGAASVDASGQADCAVIDEGSRRPLEVEVEVPAVELGAIATTELWAEVLGRIARLALENRTTLVFVNTRRLVERVSHQLAERLGEDAVLAHHGSLSYATRLRAEERLKRGEARVCVATASLELGIDVGTVDLVCQVGSPRSVSIALQRIGRSGHGLGRTPRGRLFPLTRDELLECVALVRLARRGELDRLSVPPWPLDVLAQQVVAAAASEPFDEDCLFALVTRAWPYRDLPRARFDQVIEALSSGVERAGGRRGAYLHRDGVNRRVSARRGARLAALTSGGAIPDNADYDVVLEPEGTLVGRVNEDFAIESMRGDVFLLGNASWRVLRIERARVRVEDARGAAPTVPFWVGEAPGRTAELSQAVGRLRAEIDLGLDRPEREVERLEREEGLARAAAEQAVGYVAEGKRVLGTVPTDQRIVAERFFDETGGMQLVIHAPFGSRINRAWGLALRKRFCRSFDFELQASAGDDGINLSLGPQHSFPLAEVFDFLRARSVGEVLTQAVLASPIFTSRWRWTLGRALAVRRHEMGKPVPAPLKRMRADDLLSAIFPAQSGCQDNRGGGDIAIPDHFLVFETLRDCLEEALDLPGLERLLGCIERGEIEVLARDTTQPSVFAHQILNAMPYAFLDDAPLEERRARAVALRRALPDDARELGRLDPEAVRAAGEDARPRPRDAEELHDALLCLLLVPADALEHRFGPGAPIWLEELAAACRVVRLDGYWTAAEREAAARAALQGEEAACVAWVRGFSEAMGPFRAKDLAQELGLAESRVRGALASLEAEGAVLQGSFTAGEADEWCDRRILARIHRATLGRLRREIEPVTTAVFLRFLAGWQMALPGRRGEGAGGVLEAIGLLQGYEAAVLAWEESILPVRVEGYRPEWLDRLCLGGEVAWGRFSRRGVPEAGEGRRSGIHRSAYVSLALREDLPWLVERVEGEIALGSRARLVADLLAARGAMFSGDLVRAAHLLPSELEDALGELVAAGLATADGFAPLRALTRKPAERRHHGSRFGRRRAGRVEGEGRWSLIERRAPEPEEAMADRAAQALRRYGVLFRDLLQRESAAPAWIDLVRVLRRAEARGEVRGGRFVAAVAGEQFALPEAVEALRAARRAEAEGVLVVISACDPLNLAGIVTPGPRVPALAGNRLVLEDGLPIAWADADGAVGARDGVEPEAVERARRLLGAAGVGAR